MLPIKNRILKISSLDIEDVFALLSTSRHGLTVEEVKLRLQQYGSNDIAREKPPTWYEMILNNFKNPFILVLIVLGVVSYITHDLRATIVVTIMVVISVLMRFIQEFRSSRAAEVLRKMVRVDVTVRRIKEEEKNKGGERMDVPLEELVPGDIVYLSAGDMVPADMRLISSKDLFISQSALTGESMPVEKHDIDAEIEESNPLEKNNLCFMGTNVISGFGSAVVASTGSSTYLGSLSQNIMGDRPETSFDKGINKVTWLLIRFILVMVPIIFLINGFSKGDWKDSFLFAIAVAVGLTPEMLPMIVTANLAKGAVAMSRFKVIVKRLNSIQSFGAMDILCTDKTGTLTQDKIILEKYLDTSGEESVRVLEHGFLNSFFQSGLKNMLDRAILHHSQIERQLIMQEDYEKIDEIPFDFIRKRLSVIVKEGENQLLVCKGAVEEVLKICTEIEFENKVVAKTEGHTRLMTEMANQLGQDGFRVIAV